MTRRPLEVVVVVRREGAYLVLRRSPERDGYWNLVAGGVGWDEEPAAAAARELREETGLAVPVEDLALRAAYAPGEALRARFGEGVEQVELAAYLAEAPPGWEPELDEEHDDHRWLDAEAAVALLAYPEPRAAVRAAVERR